MVEIYDKAEVEQHSQFAPIRLVYIKWQYTVCIKWQYTLCIKWQYLDMFSKGSCVGGCCP